jgi:CRP/FNR family transcriptional regulator
VIKVDCNHTNSDADVDSSRCMICGVRSKTFCKHLKADEFDQLLKILKCETVSAGGVLFEEGEPANRIYSVTDGVIRLTHNFKTGRRLIFGFMYPGDTFGFEPGGTHTVSAEAIGPVKVCSFDTAGLRRIGSTYPAIEEQLLEVVTEDLAQCKQHGALLSVRSAQGRLASFLTTMVKRAEREGESPNELNLPMPRVDIADFLGVAFETLSRAFGQLQKENVISLKGRRTVFVLDQTALADLAQEE